MSESTFPLKNKWVVITRPKHQAENLRFKLESAGANVILFPLLEIAPPNDLDSAKQQLESLADYDLVIFISPNAVDECFRWVDSSRLNNTAVASVGAKTTCKLNELGVEVDTSPQSVFNSESLLALPAVKGLGSNKKVAILRGEDGRDLIKQKLEQQGCKVTHIDLYKRICPQTSLKTLQNLSLKNQLDIILITSGTSIKNLFSLQKYNNSDAWLNETSLIVGSERIKQQVLSSTSHSGELLSTINPSDENLYQKVLEWSKHK